MLVMAHGLGGVRQMRLDAFAERFSSAGYRCLVFDYRHFGASAGGPGSCFRFATNWRIGTTQLHKQGSSTASIRTGSSCGAPRSPAGTSSAPPHATRGLRR